MFLSFELTSRHIPKRRLSCCGLRLCRVHQELKFWVNIVHFQSQQMKITCEHSIPYFNSSTYACLRTHFPRIRGVATPEGHFPWVHTSRMPRRHWDVRLSSNIATARRSSRHTSRTIYCMQYSCKIMSDYKFVRRSGPELRQSRSHGKQGGANRSIILSENGPRFFLGLEVGMSQFDSPSCVFFSLFHFFSQLSTAATQRKKYFFDYC